MKYSDFVEAFHAIAKEVAEISEGKGWSINSSTEGISSKIALMHSELSEALEALRRRDPPSDHIPPYSGMEEEFADVIIRIMHVAHALELRVGEAIIKKIEFNGNRPYKHGGKKI